MDCLSDLFVAISDEKMLSVCDVEPFYGDGCCDHWGSSTHCLEHFQLGPGAGTQGNAYCGGAGKVRSNVGDEARDDGASSVARIQQLFPRLLPDDPKASARMVSSYPRHDLTNQPPGRLSVRLISETPR